MDLALTEEMRAVQAAAREFARRHIVPIARACDEAERFPREVFERAFADGLMTGGLPRELGGLGWGPIELMLIAEELAAACSGIATSMLVHYLPLEALTRFATPAQQATWLPRLTERLTFVSFAATEASSGQDVANGATRAVRDGDGWVLTGEKQFITNASHADYFVTIARTDDPPAPHAPRPSMFVVPRDAPGLTVGPPVPKLGQRASDTASVSYADVRLPADALIGVEGEGLAQAVTSLAKSRTLIGAMAIGVARAALDLALTTAQRKRWNRQLLYHEHYLLRLGRMDAELAGARGLVLAAAWSLATGRDPIVAASRAKLIAAEVAMRTTSEVVEMLGGMGYTRDVLAEKLMRDAKLFQIYEGPTTMQERILGTSLISGQSIHTWV